MSDQDPLFDLDPPATEQPTQAPTAEQAKRRRKRELSHEYIGLGGRLDVWQRCPQCASQFFAEHRCHMSEPEAWTRERADAKAVRAQQALREMRDGEIDELVRRALEKRDADRGGDHA